MKRVTFRVPTPDEMHFEVTEGTFTVTASFRHHVCTVSGYVTDDGTYWVSPELHSVPTRKEAIVLARITASERLATQVALAKFDGHFELGF